ncbi:uncharacterized protein CANTADRAFT_23192 [Suhomyces tanzawaensis NRRL Y-17324]|uniref:Uncharacterized protein n=1 Tax=Suhomyces tanzawaensis NRRL Y-17324 TaxID=984487 RepID=A0A1E4SF13_9ASCO|nr:uncharacterized protein CANTADRAFT_23192 [Suhomyces tanzawaensis NRRL Y-17324]ODV78088.1 hypothetical protein CANTADRAFT_23192 [Suhomyces tanzawaensis NRRL Y-17324]
MSTLTFPFSSTQIDCVRCIWYNLRIIAVRRSEATPENAPKKHTPMLRSSKSLPSIRAPQKSPILTVKTAFIVKHLPNLPTFQYQICSKLRQIDHNKSADARDRSSLPTLDPSLLESLIFKYRLDKVLDFIAIAVTYLELRLPIPETYVEWLTNDEGIRQWSPHQFEVFSQALLETLHFESNEEESVFQKFVSSIFDFVMGRTLGSMLERLPSPTIEPQLEPQVSITRLSYSLGTITSHKSLDNSLFSDSGNGSESFTTNETFQRRMPMCSERQKKGLFKRIASSFRFKKLRSVLTSNSPEPPARTSPASSGSQAPVSMLLATDTLSRSTTILQSGTSSIQRTSDDQNTPKKKTTMKSSPSVSHIVMLDGSLMPVSRIHGGSPAVPPKSTVPPYQPDSDEEF